MDTPLRKAFLQVLQQLGEGLGWEEGSSSTPTVGYYALSIAPGFRMHYERMPEEFPRQLLVMVLLPDQT